MSYRPLYLFLFLFLATVSLATAQDIPAAVRFGDLDVGGTYSNASTDLDGTLTGTTIAAPKSRIWGGSIYANFNVGQYLGLTAQFDYPDYKTPDDYLEKSYLIGIRGLYPVRTRYVPYAKVLLGLASTSYDKPTNWVTVPGTPGSYGAFAYGAGLDIRYSHNITVRAIDFQLEDWPGFPGGAIRPSIISIGASYRIR
jgi:opacity protein-like surface antigen